MICFYFLKLSCVVFNDTLSLKSWNVVLKRLGQEEPGQDHVNNVNVIINIYQNYTAEPPSVWPHPAPPQLQVLAGTTVTLRCAAQVSCDWWRPVTRARL